tara:strand:+ start:188 stop:7315 length:7128 start_codon:yes stop_codon:yes gene_type:complete
MNCIVFIIFTLVIFGVFVCLKNNGIFKPIILEGMNTIQPLSSSTVEARQKTDIFKSLIEENRLGKCVPPDIHSQIIAEIPVVVEEGENAVTTLLNNSPDSSIEEQNEAKRSAIWQKKLEIFDKIKTRCLTNETNAKEVVDQTAEGFKGTCIATSTGQEAEGGNVPCLYIPGLTGDLRKDMEMLQTLIMEDGEGKCIGSANHPDPEKRGKPLQGFWSESRCTGTSGSKFSWITPNQKYLRIEEMAGDAETPGIAPEHIYKENLTIGLGDLVCLDDNDDPEVEECSNVRKSYSTEEITFYDDSNFTFKIPDKAFPTMMFEDQCIDLSSDPDNDKVYLNTLPLDKTECLVEENATWHDREFINSTLFENGVDHYRCYGEDGITPLEEKENSVSPPAPDIVGVNEPPYCYHSKRGNKLKIPNCDIIDPYGNPIIIRPTRFWWHDYSHNRSLKELCESVVGGEITPTEAEIASDPELNPYDPIRTWRPNPASSRYNSSTLIQLMDIIDRSEWIDAARSATVADQQLHGIQTHEAAATAEAIRAEIQAAQTAAATAAERICTFKHDPSYRAKAGEELPPDNSPLTYTQYIQDINNKLECSQNYTVDGNIFASACSIENGPLEITGCKPNECTIGENFNKAYKINIDSHPGLNDIVTVSELFDGGGTHKILCQDGHYPDGGDVSEGPLVRPTISQENIQCVDDITITHAANEGCLKNSCSLPAPQDLNKFEWANQKPDCTQCTVEDWQSSEGLKCRFDSDHRYYYIDPSKNFSGQKNDFLTTEEKEIINGNVTCPYDKRYDGQLLEGVTIESKFHFKDDACYEVKCQNPVNDNAKVFIGNNLEEYTIQKECEDDNRCESSFDPYVLSKEGVLPTETSITADTLIHHIKCGTNYRPERGNNLELSNILCYNAFDIDNIYVDPGYPMVYGETIPTSNDWRAYLMTPEDDRFSSTIYDASNGNRYGVKKAHVENIEQGHELLFSLNGCEPNKCKWATYSEEELAQKGYRLPNEAMLQENNNRKLGYMYTITDPVTGDTTIQRLHELDEDQKSAIDWNRYGNDNEVLSCDIGILDTDNNRECYPARPWSNEEIDRMRTKDGEYIDGSDDSSKLHSIGRGGPFTIARCYHQNSLEPYIRCTNDQGEVDISSLDEDSCLQNECTISGDDLDGGIQITIEQKTEEGTLSEATTLTVINKDSTEVEKSIKFNVDQIRNITCENNSSKPLLEPVDVDTAAYIPNIRIQCSENSGTFEIANKCEKTKCFRTQGEINAFNEITDETDVNPVELKLYPDNLTEQTPFISNIRVSEDESIIFGENPDHTVCPNIPFKIFNNNVKGLPSVDGGYAECEASGWTDINNMCDTCMSTDPLTGDPGMCDTLTNEILSDCSNVNDLNLIFNERKKSLQRNLSRYKIDADAETRSFFDTGTPETFNKHHYIPSCRIDGDVISNNTTSYGEPSYECGWVEGQLEISDDDVAVLTTTAGDAPILKLKGCQPKLCKYPDLENTNFEYKDGAPTESNNLISKELYSEGIKDIRCKGAYHHGKVYIEDCPTAEHANMVVGSPNMDYDEEQRRGINLTFIQTGDQVDTMTFALEPVPDIEDSNDCFQNNCIIPNGTAPINSPARILYEYNYLFTKDGYSRADEDIVKNNEWKRKWDKVNGTNTTPIYKFDFLNNTKYQDGLPFSIEQFKQGYDLSNPLIEGPEICSANAEVRTQEVSEDPVEESIQCKADGINNEEQSHIILYLPMLDNDGNRVFKPAHFSYFKGLIKEDDETLPPYCNELICNKNKRIHITEDISTLIEPTSSIEGQTVAEENINNYAKYQEIDGEQERVYDLFLTKRMTLSGDETWSDPNLESIKGRLQDLGGLTEKYDGFMIQSPDGESCLNKDQAACVNAPEQCIFQDDRGCFPKMNPFNDISDTRQLVNEQEFKCNYEAGYSNIETNETKIQGECKDVEGNEVFDVNGCAINYCYMPPLSETYKYHITSPVGVDTNHMTIMENLMDIQELSDEDLTQESEIGKHIANLGGGEDDINAEQYPVRRRLLTQKQLSSGRIECSKYAIPDPDSDRPKIRCNNTYDQGKQIIGPFEYSGCILPPENPDRSYRSGTTSYEFINADCLNEWNDGITYISGQNLETINDYGSNESEIGQSVTHYWDGVGNNWEKIADRDKVIQNMYLFMSKSKDLCDKNPGCIGFTVRTMDEIEAGGRRGVMMSKQYSEGTCLQSLDDMETPVSTICQDWRNHETEGYASLSLEPLKTQIPSIDEIIDNDGNINNRTVGDEPEVPKPRGSSCLYTNYILPDVQDISDKNKYLVQGPGGITITPNLIVDVFKPELVPHSHHKPSAVFFKLTSHDRTFNIEEGGNPRERFGSEYELATAISGPALESDEPIR